LEIRLPAHYVQGFIVNIKMKMYCLSGHGWTTIG
jgi:hypothetical protein